MNLEFCVHCDEAVDAVLENRIGISEFSASGARPPSYAHPACSPRSRRLPGSSARADSETVRRGE